MRATSPTVVDGKETPTGVSDDEPFVLRRNDFSLSAEQLALRDAFDSFFDSRCSTERVRKAEPLGFDAALWQELSGLGLVAMAVPASCGGDGGGLVEMAIAAESAGRRAAPVPVVETVVAARLVAGIDGPAADEALDRILGGQPAAVALASADQVIHGARLVPGGAAATTALALLGDALVISTPDESPELIPNLAGAPLAFWDFTGSAIVARGDKAETLFTRAEQEWQVLTAATLVGLGQAAQALAVPYAKDRTAFGVPIGSFQAVAHALADVAIGIEAARRLTHKAAWYAEYEPHNVGALASMAFIQAAVSAERAGEVGIHTLGGTGYTLESDMQLFYRRAKGWALAGGGRSEHYRRIADALYGPVTQEIEKYQ
jgi:alkylation response protein AidB-like acyl-CoA dehydrogenase